VKMAAAVAASAAQVKKNTARVLLKMREAIMVAAPPAQPAAELLSKPFTKAHPVNARSREERLPSSARVRAIRLSTRDKKYPSTRHGF